MVRVPTGMLYIRADLKAVCNPPSVSPTLLGIASSKLGLACNSWLVLPMPVFVLFSRSLTFLSSVLPVATCYFQLA